jgi:signal transduction histidine kinase
MTDLGLRALQIVDAAAFLLIGVLALRDWWRGRERRRGYLAIALGCLGLVALGAGIEPLTGHPATFASVLVVISMISAGALVLYRNSVLPLPWWALAVAGAGLAGATALSFIVGLPVAARPGVAPTEDQILALDLLLVVWCVAVAEPAYRLARLSANLPAVQRARMRSIAAGYGGIMIVVALILVAFTIGGDGLAIALQAVALACVLPLYVGFAPPGWLRRIWRRPEEDRLRRAIHDLLLFSPDRSALAVRGLDWAIRLVGGDAGLIGDADGALLATQGISEAEARRVLERLPLPASAPLVQLRRGSRSAIVHALPVNAGEGVLVVLSGSLSPTFDAEEADWLAGYTASLSIALDRVRVAELSVETEAELRNARDLAQAANQAKSEFLSRLSHELRTPLTAMIGFADLLLTEPLDPQQEHHVRTILKAGDHLLALVNDILDISRIEEGRLSLSTEPVAVGQAVREVLDLTRPMAAELATTVRVKGISDELIVAADHQRLKQVLLNFVSNAIKYNRRGGWVEITAARHDGSCRIAVHDSGPGLRREEMERLFAPFERLSAATSGVEGTGLGLALSKSLTEAMGGRIGVDSRVGKGSTFWVELPLTSGGEGLPAADEAERTEPPGEVELTATAARVELVATAGQNLVGHRAGGTTAVPEGEPGAGPGAEEGGHSAG